MASQLVIRLLLVSASVLIHSGGCANGADVRDPESLRTEIERLYEKGDLDGAIKIASVLSSDPDPEIRFGVGYLYLARSQDDGSSEHLRREDLREALRLIEGAARENLQQAASFLENAYEQGRYGFEKDASAAACWRAVALEGNDGRLCP